MRRIAHPLRSSIVLLFALVVVLGTVPGLVAADQRAGGSVVIGADEVVTGGLDVVAGSLVIDGVVEGDLSGAAGSVVINGEVTGDVAIGTGSLRIGEDAVIGGSLAVGAGSVVVAGTVQGDAAIGADTLRLTDTARFGGDLEYDVGTLDRADGAVVAGEFVRNDDLGRYSGPVGDVDLGVFDASPITFVWGLLVTLAVGAILLVALPERSAQVIATSLARPVEAGVAGVLAFVAAIVALVLVTITIVGIPIAIVGALLFALVAWVGSIYGRIAVGDWALAQLGVDGGRWGGLLVGVVGIALVGLVPWLGGLVELLVFLVGFGAVSLLTYEHYRRGDRDTPTTTDVPSTA